MKLRIISFDDKTFQDRWEAGVLLGVELKKNIREKPLILGIPRGGMVTAQAISSVTGGEIDIMLTHKIGAPDNPELAIGAISENGQLFLNNNLVEDTGADREYINSVKMEQLEELKRRRELFRAVHPKIPLKDRVVVITDDGIATGATVQVALWAARQERPKKLIGAFPVAPMGTLKKLNADADEIICLKAPAIFYAISQFYLSFDQVTDEQVLNILREANEQKKERAKKCAHN